ncbi:uncharacterized protein [Hyperolius riggenbachi]|uniref:uncharacterized protein n=1 Tax=Hyperolius riggenbachi TaxID=752182 RepID=UPI0035A30A75
MKSGNQSIVEEFILLGLSEDPLAQLALFYVFLIVYMTTIAGNLLLIVAVGTDKRLHTSMYFFLANLSFLDICYTSVTVPKMLVNFLSRKKSISFIGCAIQVYFYLFMAETECILLALMAYDRYVAICHPLRYHIIMTTAACLFMISMSWLSGCIITSIDTFFIFRLTYCGPNTINHFFCEAPLLLQLTCSDSSTTNILKLVGTAIFLFIPLSLILISYLRIIACIVKLHSGKYNAFSTCISHLLVVIIFYGTGIFMYIRPEHSGEEDTDKLVAVFYTVITPMLNPVIYSLRNKDVQRAMKKLISRLEAFHKNSAGHDLLKDLFQARQELRLLLLHKFEFNMLRTKSKYYSQSNKSGALLAQRCKIKQAKSRIPFLIDPLTNQRVTNPKLIADIFASFYRDLYNLQYDTKTPQPSPQQIEEFLSTPKLPSLSQDHLDSLNAPITALEVISLIKSLKHNKAPGPDGYSNEYYQTYATILAPRLAKVFNTFRSSGQIPQEYLLATVVVLPKAGKDLSNPASFRPISLLNTDTKLYAKILAHRLLDLLPLLVKNDQVGFTKNRQSSDGTRKMISLLHYLETGRTPSVFLTLDAEKAFDRVHWLFLEHTLKKMWVFRGFSEGYFGALFQPIS